MKELLAKIEKIVAAILGTKKALALHQGRWQKQHDRAHKNRDRAIAASEKADQSRKAGQPGQAAKQDRAAAYYHLRAHRAHVEAQVQIAAAKRLNAKLNGLATTHDELKKKLAAAKKKANKVTIKGNKVSGGEVGHRIQVCMLQSAHNCGTGKRPNFYSQSGDWDVEHCLTGEPRGHRSDCSSWATSVFWSCGQPDPNGANYSSGYTGTLGENGKRITRETATHTPGARVLFGTAPYHHVELALGDGTEHTVGHGSPPVDLGTFDLLPGSVTFVA